MEQRAAPALIDHLAVSEDPRQQAKVLYPLPEIVLLLFCATLAGADDFVETQLWGEENLGFLRRHVASLGVRLMMTQSCPNGLADSSTTNT